MMVSSRKAIQALLSVVMIPMLSSCSEVLTSQEFGGNSEFVVHTMSGTGSSSSQIEIAEIDGQICYLDEATGWMRKVEDGKGVLQLPEGILDESAHMLDGVRVVQLNEHVYAWRRRGESVFVRVNSEWEEIGLNGRILGSAQSGSTLALGIAWHRPESFAEDVYEAILLEGGNVVSKSIINANISGSGSIWYVEESGSLVATVRGEKVMVVDELPSKLGLEYRYLEIICADEDWCAVAWSSERTGRRERELAFVSIEGDILKAEALAGIVTLEIQTTLARLAGADSSGLWMLARVGDSLQLLTFHDGDLKTVLVPDSGWRLATADYNDQRLVLVEATFSNGDTDVVHHTTRLREYDIDSTDGGVRLLTEVTAPGTAMFIRHRLLISGGDAYVVVHSDPFAEDDWTTSLLRIPLRQGD